MAVGLGLLLLAAGSPGAHAAQLEVNASHAHAAVEGECSGRRAEGEGCGWFVDLGLPAALLLRVCSCSVNSDMGCGREPFPRRRF